jgi:lipoprotein-anchoring transpeptidase ErfK/SrfK
LPKTIATALLAVFIAAAAGLAAAQDKSLEELVEEALERNAAGGAPEGQAEGQVPGSAVPPRIGVEPAPAPAALPELAAPAGDQPAPGQPAAEAAPAQPAAEAQPVPAVPPAAEAGPLPAEPAPAAEAGAAPAEERTLGQLKVEEVNAATFAEHAETIHGASPLVLKAQILLDRAGASPGVIDAYYGGNVAKAIAAVETVLGLPVDGQLDKEVWAALGGDQAPPVLVEYTITEEDASYPFLPGVPQDYAEQAQLPGLNYTSPEERFGEIFHMDVDLLKALNPGVDMRQPGATIVVAAVEGQPVTGKISRIEADKARRQVRAYDAENRLIVAYPATIGSADNPSPSGRHEVEGVAPNPIYYYNPENFVQGENREKLELPPGPNNPVGTMWIDLSRPSYGIHGTPEPSKIDKTGSHGCVRLTNWDAEELANLVEPGVSVEFTE